MKKFWYSIKTIILSYTIQFLFAFLAIIAYITINSDVSSVNIDILIKYLIVAITISTIPVSIYLYKKYKIKEEKLDYKKLLIMIPLGIGTSLFYNMLTINYQEPQTLLDLNIYLIILYTAILGPIFEELVFRYVSIKKAKEVYNENTAIIIITIIFALMHSGIINITYAFLIGLLLALIYKKYYNIIYPIIIHISANFTSIFIKEYNTLALIISTFLLILSYILLKKQKH